MFEVGNSQCQHAQRGEMRASIEDLLTRGERLINRGRPDAAQPLIDAAADDQLSVSSGSRSLFQTDSAALRVIFPARGP